MPALPSSRFPAERWLRLLALFLLPAPASVAHHSAAHGPGESLRVLGTLGTNAAPRQRAAAVVTAMQSSAEPTLAGQTSLSLSALLDVQLTRRLFLGGLLPAAVVHEDLKTSAEVGLGNLQIFSQYQLGALKQQDEASFAMTLSATFPTRTMTYEVDPGRQWVVTPGARYADQAGRWLWYGLVSVPVETRPAGTAADLSIAGGLGYRPTKGFSMSTALSADVRWLNVCADGPDLGWCPAGRTTEANRPLGATRLYVIPAVTADLARRWSLLGSAQFPLLPRRDLEWQLSLGAEFRF